MFTLGLGFLDLRRRPMIDFIYDTCKGRTLTILEWKLLYSGSKFYSTITKTSTAGSLQVVSIFSVISVREDVNKEN